MPKKKEIDKKKEMLDELALRLKFSINKSEEEKQEVADTEEGSELEEEAEDTNLDLQNLEFHQFMSSSEEGSPALERIAGSAPRPMFVRGVSQETEDSLGGGEPKDDLKYSLIAGNDSKSEYAPNAGRVEAIERIDEQNLGRRQDLFPQTNTDTFLQRDSENRGFQTLNQERAERVDRFDMEKDRRRSPSEEREAAFERYKPKVPRN